MKSLTNKIDFAVVFSVTNANPNGDPLDGNRPRETFDGHGEVSDVCLKRKIRNRWIDMGETIFVQSDDKKTDEYSSLSERAKNNPNIKAAKNNKEEYAKAACEEWIDVRSFGQVFAFKKDKDNKDGVSVGVRGPVSIHPAFSIEPIITHEMQITKSVNSEPGDKKGSDTMGSKKRVNFGVYTFYGSVNCQLAEKTGFNDEDSEKLHEALRTLFDNDASSARPEGSMEVVKVYWWKHDCKNGQYSSAKVHRLLKVARKTEKPKTIFDYEITVDTLDNLACEEYSGI